VRKDSNVSPRLTKVVAHLKTDVGMIREHNEDSACVDPRGAFFIVADGMGGHAAGEVASAMAVDEMRQALDAARAQIDEFGRHPTEEQRKALVTLLETSVQRAHQAVFERGGREADKKGMGTTLEVVLVADGEAFVAHVGDSRTYLLRSGAVAQVTTDHTVAEVLVIEGKLTAEEARLSPLRTILVNAIGVSADVGVELAHIRLRRGDKLLLCSDGLHDYFPSDTELGELLAAERDGEKGLERLVTLAKERGGHDNITGILVEVVDGNPSMDEEAEEAKRLAKELGEAQTTEDQLAVPQPVGDEPTAPQDTDEEGKAKDKDRDKDKDRKDRKDARERKGKREREKASRERNREPEKDKEKETEKAKEKEKDKKDANGAEKALSGEGGDSGSGGDSKGEAKPVEKSDPALR
jgi:serine/threonine protein phosphatase PrpC